MKTRPFIFYVDSFREKAATATNISFSSIQNRACLTRAGAEVFGSMLKLTACDVSNRCSNLANFGSFVLFLIFGLALSVYLMDISWRHLGPILSNIFALSVVANLVVPGLWVKADCR